MDGSPDDDRLARLRELADLRDRGALTDEEFASEKARLLATSPSLPRPAQPKRPPVARATGGRSAPRPSKPARSGGGKLALWASVAVGVVAVIAALSSGSKPKTHGATAPSAATGVPTTASVRAAWRLPLICGDGGDACVPASDVSISNGVVIVQTDWADTALVTANAANGGGVSPGQGSLAEQLCLDAEDAGATAPTLAQANGWPTYVPAQVLAEDSALLSSSTGDDGTCSS